MRRYKTLAYSCRSRFECSAHHCHRLVPVFNGRASIVSESATLNAPGSDVRLPDQLRYGFSLTHEFNMSFALLLLAKAVAVPAPVPTPVSAVADACANLLPPALVSKLQTEQPGFELPRAAQAGEARLQLIAKTGAWPCPFITLGDFDGNGWLDRALLLSDSNGAVRLVAALNTEGSWQLALNEEWGIAMVDSYLQPLEAGLYQRHDASSKPAAELDLLGSIQSDSPGFTAGKWNGRYAVYFFQESAWRHLWMQD